METKYYRVLKEFIDFHSGRYLRPGAVYTITTYSGNAFVRSMLEHEFLKEATPVEAEKAEQKRLRKVSRWARNARP